MNDEFQMTKEIRNSNAECNSCDVAGIIWTFVLRHSFDIRHPDFVIVQCGVEARRIRMAKKTLLA